MMAQNDDSDFSDEELCWGKITPKHVEKSISLRIQRHKFLNSFCEVKSSKDPTSIAADIERYLIEQSSDNKLETVGLHNKEYGQDMDENKQKVDDDNKYFNYDLRDPNNPNNKKSKIQIQSQSATQNEGEFWERNEDAAVAAKLLLNFESSETYNTPYNIKKIKAGCSINTPEKSPCILKTPISSKLKPNSKNTYDHIASPVATYIRKSPQVPLVKDVVPKKPLPTSSLTPKLVSKTPTSPKSKISDKENFILPQLAYRSAKETIVINLDEEKLPQGNWAQKLQTSAQKPVVLKHQFRESGRKPLVSQQDSIADLSLHQADISICTEKQAFTELKKKA